MSVLTFAYNNNNNGESVCVCVLVFIVQPPLNKHRGGGSGQGELVLVCFGRVFGGVEGTCGDLEAILCACTVCAWPQ